MNASALPCRLMDADQHSMRSHDACERRTDPLQRDKAVRTVRGPDGEVDRDIAKFMPGSLLSRLNLLRSLDAAGREDFVDCYRDLPPLLDNLSRSALGHGRSRNRG